ncbi:MAG: YaiO family outer membrane beta-barrel protein [Verrucomicrobiae bacterium]|nr:YaiO family outer membrane beta-barrel protein [Verrucomicrobiae bacterium]
MLRPSRSPNRLFIVVALVARLVPLSDLSAQVNGPVWVSTPPEPGYKQPAPRSALTSAAVPRASSQPNQPGRIAGALAENRAAQRQQPQDVQLKIQEARYLSWLSRHYTAASRYRAILREHPKHVDALTGYGSALFWQGDWRNAQNVLAHAVSLAKPDDIAPRVAFLRVLAKQGQASLAHRQALALDQQSGRRDAELGLLIADMMASVGLRQDGLPYADRPTTDVDLQVRQAEYRARQVIELGGKKQTPNLAADLATRFGRLYNSHTAAGDLLALHGFEREAAAYYQQAINLEPEREEARLGLARVLRTRGRHADALNSFQSAIQNNPESLNGWIGVAEMSRLQGDEERAWQALDTALTIAPASAEVFRERLKLASQSKDTTRFQSELAHYRQAQPQDPWVSLLAERRAASEGRSVNEPALRALLDPMAPDVNAEVALLLQNRNIATELPKTDSPALNAAAGRELHRRLDIRIPSSVNLTAGYEYSSLKASTILGGTFPDWHEAFLAGFWRREGGRTFTFDYRHFERFGANAQQLQSGVLQPLGNRWTVGGNLGGALFGHFIPHWRLGIEAGYQATKRLGLRFEYRHLRFTDEPVHQFIPEASWQWHPKLKSTARLYVTHSVPNGRASDTGLSAYFDLAYLVASNSQVKIHYAIGDENASALIQNLIGERNFQSTGIELRLGINERWAIVPSYRFERHNLFDLHAAGLSLNGRF